MPSNAPARRSCLWLLAFAWCACGTEADEAEVNEPRGLAPQVADARCANGKRVSVHVTLSDSAGESAEDTRYYFAELAPAQRRAACP